MTTPHKHAKFIKLMADGVVIEVRPLLAPEWRPAIWNDFGFSHHDFRISPDQPPDADGWIPYHGNGNPAPGQRVTWKSDNDYVSTEAYPSEEISWDGVMKITAYRIHAEPKKIELWQWLWRDDTGRYHASSGFYPSTDAATRALMKRVLCRLDHTRIEVSADE